MSKDTTIKSITFFHRIVNWCKYIEGIKHSEISGEHVEYVWCGLNLEEMDGDGLQLKNRMHIAREIESSYNDSRK
mgnify:CR=1 FL=1